MSENTIKYPENSTIVKVSDINLQDRSREDFGDVDDLAKSIQNYGLIHPPTVMLSDENTSQLYVLVAGGRRTRAMMSLGLESIPVNITDNVSQGLLAELELEENLQRKNMQWWEEVLIIEKAHKRYSLDAIKLDSNWGTRQTGKMMGVSHVHVAHALMLAIEIGKGNVSLKEATNIKQAYRLLLQQREDSCEELRAARLRKNSQSKTTHAAAAPIPDITPPTVSIANILDGDMDSLSKSLEVKPVTVDAEQVITLSDNFKVGDSVFEVMPTLPDECFDHIVTDPPYGININEDFMVDNDSIKETHKVQDNIDMFLPMFEQFYRTLRNGGFCVVWYDMKYQELFIQLATQVGFKASAYPIIWNKLHKCRNMAGETTFTKQYETAMVFRKGDAVMNVTGETNVVTANGLLERQKYSNPFSKPMTVWQHIIMAISKRNDIIADPFGGQFSCPLAALACGRKVWSCEIDEKHFNAGINHVQDFYLELSDNKVTFE